MEKTSNSLALRRVGALFAITAAVAVTACGGGGSPSPSPAAPTPSSPTPPAPTPSSSVTAITDSQTGASGLVAVVNANVETVAQADAASNAPGAVGALITDLPTGAVTTQTQQCSELGSILGGTGSGSYTYTSDIDTNAYQVKSISVQYNNCTYSFSGATLSYNGTMAFTYGYTGTNISSVNYTYDLTYAYSGAYGSDSGTLKSSSTCSVLGGQYDCSYNIGSAAVRNVNVSRNGTKTTVTSATVKTNGSATSNNLTVTYSGWVYDSATGRATSGTVTVTDTNGRSATITVTSTGYRVVITAGGTTRTYDIAYS